MNMKHRLLYILALMFATLQTFAQTYTYDDDNRLMKVEYDNGITVKYEYDELGNRISKKVSGSTAKKFTISVSVTPSGSGSVTGGGTYSSGTSVELKAIAKAGYKFSKWSTGETDNPLTIKVSKDVSYKAEFVETSSDMVGDVVPDGVINRQDVDALVDAYTNGTAVTSVTDINGDNQLTIADVTKLISMLPQENSGNNDDTPSSHNGHEYVDLGLPSGTLWATCNIGATNPEGTGCYYAWAEVKGSCDGKDNFISTYYKYDNGQLGDQLTKYCSDSSYGYNGFTDNLSVLEPEDDAASTNWGSSWRTPTKTEVNELKNKKYTSWTLTTKNGVQGFVVTSLVEGYTDKSIFLPAVGGVYTGKQIDYADEFACYWTATLYRDNDKASAWDLRASGSTGSSSRDRSYGLLVRPVISKSAISK